MIRKKESNIFAMWPEKTESKHPGVLGLLYLGLHYSLSEGMEKAVNCLPKIYSPFVAINHYIVGRA